MQSFKCFTLLYNRLNVAALRLPSTQAIVRPVLRSTALMTHNFRFFYRYNAISHQILFLQSHLQFLAPQISSLTLLFTCKLMNDFGWIFFPAYYMNPCLMRKTAPPTPLRRWFFRLLVHLQLQSLFRILCIYSVVFLVQYHFLFPLYNHNFCTLFLPSFFFTLVHYTILLSHRQHSRFFLFLLCQNHYNKYIYFCQH